MILLEKDFDTFTQCRRFGQIFAKDIEKSPNLVTLVVGKDP